MNGWQRASTSGFRRCLRFEFPARISWVKNQLGLLWSLALLVRWGALPEGTVFLLAGRPRDRIPSALLPKLARALGVEKYLRVLPPEKEPRVLYTASDALALPSWAEGMPNVVLEAQLMGLPVVVTRQANWDAAVLKRLLRLHGEHQIPTRHGRGDATPDVLVGDRTSSDGRARPHFTAGTVPTRPIMEGLDFSTSRR